MNKFIKMSAVAIAAAAASCSSSLNVSSDYDKTVAFQQYKSFTMSKVDPAKQSVSQLNADRISNAIRAELVKKGMVELETGGDVVVHSVAVIKDKTSVSATTDYYGYGGPYRPYAWGTYMGVGSQTTYNVRDYKDGSLIIDIADGKTQKLIWEGVGNKEIDKPLSDPDKEIRAAIASILAKFPPPPAKG